MVVRGHYVVWSSTSGVCVTGPCLRRQPEQRAMGHGVLGGGVSRGSRAVDGSGERRSAVRGADPGVAEENQRRKAGRARRRGGPKEVGSRHEESRVVNR
jgi:hypothetical protein